MQKIILTCLTVFLLLIAQPGVTQANVHTVRVGLVWQLAGQDYIGFEVVKGTYRLSLDEKPIRAVNAGIAYRAGAGPWGMAVFQQGQPLGFFTKISLEPVNGNLPVFKVYSAKGSRTYRGSLEIVRQQDGSLRVVNTLGEQEYLFGVVPMEMSNSWAAKGLEALKAQAVAARTYLYTHYDTKQTKGYNITDSPNIDQAYAGYSAEGVASRAVEATQGELIVDRNTDKPISAAYSSHSGGHTEDSENVWGGVDPHLRGKPDPYSFGVGSLADHWSYTASAIAVGKPLGLGPVVDIKLQKYPSGRVKTVTLKDISGRTVTKSGRKFVSLYYPSGRGISPQDFLGSMFSVRVLTKGDSVQEFPKPLDIFIKREQLPKGPRLNRIDTSVTPLLKMANPYPVYVFSGSGWGHGVGMSQWGAYGMAQSGYTYRQILEYYYTNVKILKLN